MDDPWAWKTDQLVAEVCQSTKLFRAAGCAPGGYPDRVALEHQLRAQQVTGETLLSLDLESLRHKLGLNDLRQRHALIKVIAYLRSQSAGYNQHAATLGVNNLFLDNRTPPTPSQAKQLTRRVPETAPNAAKKQKTTHITLTPQTVSQTPYHATPAGSTTYGDPQPTDVGGEWDHLLRWQDVHDYEIDADLVEGEPSDDDELHYGTDAAGEEGEEQDVIEIERDDERNPGGTKLSRDEITAIINERIEDFTNEWVPNKGEKGKDKVNYDPEKMWTEAEESGQRARRIENYKSDIAYYKHRLDELCDNIIKFPGRNKDTVRHQCQNLELTVNSLQLAEWLLSIYELDPEEESEMEGSHSRSPSIEEQTIRPPAHASTIDTATPQTIEVIDLESPKVSNHVGSSPVPTNRIGQPMSHRNRVSIPHSTVAETIETTVSRTSQDITTVSQPVGLAVPLSDEPEQASIASVRRWSWENLVGTLDRKRIVSKALCEMDWEKRETIRNRLASVGNTDMIREIPDCIAMLSKGETKMQGVLPRDLPKIVFFTRLFLCWWLCDNYFHKEPSSWDMDELAQCLRNDSPDPGTFCDYLSKVMTTTFSYEALERPEEPSQAEIIVISSDDDEPVSRFATQR